MTPREGIKSQDKDAARLNWIVYGVLLALLLFCIWSEHWGPRIFGGFGIAAIFISAIALCAQRLIVAGIFRARDYFAKP